MFSFQQSPCFADGIIDMGRQNAWEKVKYITSGRPTTFFLIFGYPLLINNRDAQGKKSKNFSSIELWIRSHTGLFKF